MSARFSWIAVASLLALGPAALGQPRPEGTVTGHGAAEIKKQPDTLRVQVEILAKGKDLKEALAKLKERREAALVRVAGLGAAKDTIVLGEPSVTSDKTDRQKQMEAMVAQRVRPGAKPAAKKTAPPVIVGISLRAEFPLKAVDPEAMLLRVEELQEKIKSADLGGLKEIQKLSPEEEEIAEENQILQQQYGGMDNEPKKGEPAFLFVSKISDEERAKAQAEAFQKAKRDASQLARAAGSELGELRHLDGQNTSSPGDASAQAYYYQAMQYRMTQMAALEAQPGEAVGLQPGAVTFRVTVSASFALRAITGK